MFSKIPFCPFFQINNQHINISWSSPELPAGPLASYTIQIEDSKSMTIVKDLDVKKLGKGNVMRYVTGPLEYATTYKVSVYATSISGLKGDVASRTVQTASPKDSKDGPAILFFSQGNVLFKKSLEDHALYDAHEKVHEFKADIQSIDSLVSKNLVFILDKNNQVHLWDERKQMVQTIEFELQGARGLSVDWLNNFVYFHTQVNGHQALYKCDYISKQCLKLQVQIHGTMSHLKVDPFHGFLFWIEGGQRLVQTEAQCDDGDKFRRRVLIDNEHDLGSFVLLFDQFKLQIADLTENALLELDLSSLGTGSATNIK